MYLYNINYIQYTEERDGERIDFLIFYKEWTINYEDHTYYEQKHSSSLQV